MTVDELSEFGMAYIDDAEIDQFLSS